jgi:hypothetical protein
VSTIRDGLPWSRRRGSEPRLAAGRFRALAPGRASVGGVSSLSALLALILAAAPPAGPGPEAPAAPPGAQLSPLPPGDAASPWRFALTTGVAAWTGGPQGSAAKDAHPVLLQFGGQADGAWPEGHGQAARLRFRLFTGRESDIYVPSDVEAEGAYMLGRPEFRFVIGRVEVARYPGLSVQALLQAGTLPCFDGTVSLAGDTMELSYFASPVELAWVRYLGGDHLTHLPGWNTEDDRPSAASAVRVRDTLFLVGRLAASVQVDFLKFWSQPDLLLGVEGTIGWQLPRQPVALHVGVRVQSYTRRGLEKDTTARSSELMGFATAGLGF